MATSNGMKAKKSDEITIKFISMQSFIRMKILESEPLHLSESCRGFECACVCVCMSLPKIPSLARFSRHRSILRETILWGVKWVIWLLSKPTIAQIDRRTCKYIYILYIHTIRFRLSFKTIVWRVLYASSTWLYLDEHWTQCEYLAVESQHYMQSNVFNTLIQIEMNSLNIPHRRTDVQKKTLKYTFMNFGKGPSDAFEYQKSHFWDAWILFLLRSLSLSFIIAVLVVMAAVVDGGRFRPSNNM